MPAAGRRWAILALLFATRVGLGLQFQTLGSVADPLVTDLHLSFRQIGTLIGLFMVPGLVLAIPLGFAGRYVSDRALVAAGLGALALGGGVAAAADDFGLLALGRLLCGVGFVVTTIFFTKMVVDWFAGRELATAMAVLVMSWPFGIAMGQVGHSWLAATYGWRMPFIAASLYCLAGAVLLTAAYRPPPATTATVRGSIDRAHRARMDTHPDRLARVGSLQRRLHRLSELRAARAGRGRPGHDRGRLDHQPRELGDDLLGRRLRAARRPHRSFRSHPVDVPWRGDGARSRCLSHVAWAVPLSLLFGLIGMAPAGLIMALTGAAMAPHKRAFGMGIFFSAYFVVTAPAPAIAGWLFDRSHDPFLPILFAIALFALTLGAYFAFRIAQRKIALTGLPLTGAQPL